MQQKRDDLDELIFDSSIEIDPKIGYNSRLISKIDNRKKVNEQAGQKNIAAISLIMAGFMLMFIYTSNIKYTVTNIEFQVKTNISMVKNNFDFGNLLLRKW